MLFNHIEISNFTEPNVQEKAFLKQNSLHTHTHTYKGTEKLVED